MKPLPTVHPFPARMASSIVFEELSKESDQLTVVDPMAGSGTSIVAARLRGHRAFGFDVDPLAVLLAAAWARDFVPSELQYVASRVLKNAERRYKYITTVRLTPSISLANLSVARGWARN